MPPLIIFLLSFLLRSAIGSRLAVLHYKINLFYSFWATPNCCNLLHKKKFIGNTTYIPTVFMGKINCRIAFFGKQSGKEGKMFKKCKLTALVCRVVVTGVLMFFYHREVKKQQVQQDIAKEILRLHVVANSDSDEDQKLKMKVKETVVTYLRGSMSEAASVEEARAEIEKRLPQIEAIAREKMQTEGYDYEAEAQLGECYFPVKEYGDLTFPAGRYEALRVNLGASTGKNWWCVMYPSLCFVDSTYQVVPDSSKEKLKESLSEEEYNSLLDGGDKVQYSSKIIEWIGNTLFS